jgi:hypothetical protein
MLRTATSVSELDNAWCCSLALKLLLLLLVLPLLQGAAVQEDSPFASGGRAGAASGCAFARQLGESGPGSA